MSAYQILIRELAEHGQITYKTLLRKYPAYTYENFTGAYFKARRLGQATKARGQGTPIIAAGCCLCCGRKL